MWARKRFLLMVTSLHFAKRRDLVSYESGPSRFACTAVESQDPAGVAEIPEVC